MNGTELFLLIFVIGITVIFTIALIYLFNKINENDDITTRLINDICCEQNKMRNEIDKLYKGIYKQEAVANPHNINGENTITHYINKPLWETVDRLLEDNNRTNNKLSNLNYSQKELEQAKKEIAKLAKTLDDFQIEVSSCIGTLETNFNDVIQQKLLYKKVKGNVLSIN